MLDKQTRTLIAQRLNQAEKQREQIRAISLDYPSITIEDAYAVQREWVEMKIAEGRVLKGHKIGLTSKAMQASSQISEPDYGALLDDMFFHDGSDIPTDRFIVPRIEVELAFVLAKPLRGPNCTLFDVYNATDYVIPALELIDARCHNIDPETQRPRKVFDTISDNAANAGVILGGRPIKPDELDLRWISALLYRNGVIEETGVAAGVLNHPANGVAWLANKLAPYDVQLEAGQIILGGSFTRPVGLILLAMFVAYMVANVLQMKKAPAAAEAEAEAESAGEEMSLTKTLVLLVLGAVLIALGANLLVDNGTLIAQALGVPESVIALTFVALGTSLPELVTAITSLVKGCSDLSLGNIVGANVFNLVLVSGVSVTLAPFTVPQSSTLFGINSSLVLEIPVMLAVMAIMTLPALKRGKLSRAQGIILLCIYAAFCAIQFTM